MYNREGGKKVVGRRKQAPMLPTAFNHHNIFQHGYPLISLGKTPNTPFIISLIPVTIKSATVPYLFSEISGVYSDRNIWLQMASINHFCVWWRITITISTSNVTYMDISKYENTFNLLNIVKYIVHLCEINKKGIQFKLQDFSENCVHFTGTHTRLILSDTEGRKSL